MEFAKQMCGFAEQRHLVMGPGEYCEKMKHAIIGGIIGFILFFGALALIWWNEGRAVYTAESLEEGQAAVRQSGCTPDPANENQLVHMSCTITQLGSFAFSDLVQVSALWLEPDIQFFEYQEKCVVTQTGQNGQPSTCTSYSHGSNWYSYHTNSGNFRVPGYNNPSYYPAVNFYNGYSGCCKLGQRAYPTGAVMAGGFTLDSTVLSYLNSQKLYTATSISGYLGDQSTYNSNSNTGQPAGANGFSSANVRALAVGQTQFLTNANGGAKIGDQMLTFTYGSDQSVTVVAKQVGGGFAQWPSKYNPAYGIYFVRPGFVTSDSIFAEQTDANKSETWVLRVLGWLVCWGGCQLMDGPIVVFPSIIPCCGPFLSELIGCLLCVFNCMVSLAFSLLVFAIAWLRYRPYIGGPLLAGCIVLLIAVVAWRVWKKKKDEREGKSITDLPPA